jgi:hypothetical protein
MLDDKGVKSASIKSNIASIYVNTGDDKGF